MPEARALATSLAFALGRVALVAALANLPAALARAGPPFLTDDPEPVELRHWEVYLGTQGARDGSGWSATEPHVEVNYGAVRDVQLHLILSRAVLAPRGGTPVGGFGDTELGVKLRFLHEGARVPQAGTFPILDLPTGDAAQGLGAGHARLFLPVWLQKSAGPWTTYGGAGWRTDLGAASPGAWFEGVELQRKAGGGASLGGELYHAAGGGDEAETGFDLGLMLDLSALHHVLLSAGRDLSGPVRFQGYAAWQLTFGPGGAE